MTNFLVKLKNGDVVRITEDEYKKLAGKTGLIFIPSCGETIDMGMVAHILAEEKDEPDRSRQKFGVLHDGSKVVKQFGEWFDANSPIDEHGRHTVRLDPVYYPEVTKDCIPTPEEFEREYALLPPEERKTKMLGGHAAKLLGAKTGFTPIAEIQAPPSV